jgi:hypothetical protein
MAQRMEENEKPGNELQSFQAHARYFPARKNRETGETPTLPVFT